MIAGLGRKTCAVLAGLGFLAGAPAVAQTMFSASSWVPPSHAVTRTLVAWGQDVDKATSGRVKVSMLPKPPSAPTGTLDAVTSGLVDVSFISHGYTPGRFVLTRMAELPFLGDNCEAMSVAYNRIYERHLAKAGEHKGVKVLSVFTHGPGVLANTKKPLINASDLVGMKFRVGGGMVDEVAKAIGANALLKPAPELYELLTGGVVDGTFGPSEMVISFKLEKILKYMTQVPGGFYNTSFAVLMNEGRFNGLSKQDQEAIMSLSGERLSQRIGRTWDAVDKAGIDAMNANGIQIATAGPAMVKDLRDKTGGIEQDWVRQAKAKGVDGARALADLREEIKKLGTR